MKKTLITLAVASMVSTSAFAANTAACAGCHGKDFEKVAMGKSKIVKDMSKADIVAALNGYKDGSYGGAMKAIMKGQVAKLSAEDIDAIATQIAGGSEEAPKAEANATAVEKVVDAVKTEATAAATSAVEGAKAKATSAAVEAVTSVVK